MTDFGNLAEALDAAENGDEWADVLMGFLAAVQRSIEEDEPYGP